MEHRVLSVIDGDVGDSVDGIRRLVERVGRALSAPSGAVLDFDSAGCTRKGATWLAVLNALTLRQVGSPIFEERTSPIPGRDDLRSVHEIIERTSGFPIPSEWAGFSHCSAIRNPRWNDPDPFVALLRRGTAPSTDDEDDFATCLREAFQNVEDHAQSPVGCVACGLWSDAEGLVGAAVVDLGIGVRASFLNARRHSELRSDADALLAVMARGISAKTTDRNLGQGLAILRAIVTGRRGRFTIASGAALASTPHPSGDPELRHLSAGFPGTIVHFSFPVAPGGTV